MKKLLSRLMVLLLLIFAIVGILQWRSYAKLKDAYKEGMLYFEEEDYKKSCEIFEEAMKSKCIFGKNLKKEMKCYQADGYYGLGEYEQALEIYEELLSDDAYNKNIYLMKGSCYQKAGNMEGAQDAYQDGWEKTGDVDFLKKLAKICIDHNDLKAAMSYIKVGMKEGGDDVKEFLFDKIVIYEKQLDFDQAYQAAQEFCEKYPDDEKGRKERIFLSSRI